LISANILILLSFLYHSTTQLFST